MHAVTEASGELVAVKQRTEQLEVLLLAIVGGRRHQQQVLGRGPEGLAELVAQRLADLVAPEMGCHPVRLIDHHQVPLGLPQHRLQLLLPPGELVDSGYEPGLALEDVEGVDAVEVLLRDNLELQPELVEQLLLPLDGETARSDHHAPLQCAPDDHLLDVEAGHDRLAGPGIVGEQETQRPARQQRAVHRLDLVGKGPHLAGLESQIRVEQMRQTDAARLGSQPEEPSVAAEAPTSLRRGQDCEARLVVPEEHPLLHDAVLRAIGESDRLAAVPPGPHHGDRAVRVDAGHRNVGLQVLQCGRRGHPAIIRDCAVRARGDGALLRRPARATGVSRRRLAGGFRLRSPPVGRAGRPAIRRACTGRPPGAVRRAGADRRWPLPLRACCRGRGAGC